MVLRDVILRSKSQIKQIKQRVEIDGRFMEAAHLQGQLRAAAKSLQTHLRTLDEPFALDLMTDVMKYVFDHPDLSWKQIGFKDLSNMGFDYNGKHQHPIDYGNYQYSLLVVLLSHVFPESWGEFIQFMSQYWKTLNPEWRHTHQAEIMKGDLVEIFLAQGRGCGKQRPSLCIGPC